MHKRRKDTCRRAGREGSEGSRWGVEPGREGDRQASAVNVTENAA